MSTAKSAPPAAPLEEVRWTAPWKLFVAIAAAFAAMFALTIALPHDPYIRYQQLAKTLQFRSQWIYERIVFDKTPIDVAIVGNSRVATGISGPQLEALLRNDTGRPVHAANLSMPQEGRDMHYEIVKRLLDDHPEVRVIVLSAIERMPREGHPAFPDLAEASDVLGAPKLLNLGYVSNLSVLPYRQISLFLQSLAPSLFGDHTTFDRVNYPGTGYDSTGSFRLPGGELIDRNTIPDEAKLAASAHARLTGGTRRLLPPSMADYEFPIERSYTRRIVDLAKAHGVKVMFVAMPIYTDNAPIADAAFYEQFGPVIRPDFIENNSRLYSDPQHVNVEGTRQVTAWLAKQIEAGGFNGEVVR